MPSSPARAGTPTDALVAARSLGPLIDGDAVESERIGTMTPAVVQALKDRGLFQLMVPTELGGLGAELPEAVEIIEEISRQDPSAGWSYMANVVSTAALAGFCGDAAVKEMFAGPEPPIGGGMPGPAGKLVRSDGGYRLTGRYGFGSGTAHADWITAGGTLDLGGEMRQLVCLLPHSAVEDRGNWDVIGLVGTGSYDFEVADQFVPEDFTFDRLASKAKRGQASLRLGLIPVAVIGHLGVALGTAQRALEELVAVVDTGKQRPLVPPVRDQQLFLHDFAVHEARFRSSRAYGMEVVHAALESIDAGRETTELEVQRIRQASSNCVDVALDVVQFCFTWSGSVGLRQPHPLSRLIRDVHAQTQHTLIDANSYVLAAPTLMSDYRRPR